MIENEKMILLTSEHCPPCEVVKKSLKGHIPIYDITDPESDEGFNFIQKQEIKSIPTIMKRNDGRWEKCKISYSGDKVVVDCGEEHLEFTRK